MVAPGHQGLQQRGMHPRPLEIAVRAGDVVVRQGEPAPPMRVVTHGAFVVEVLDVDDDVEVGAVAGAGAALLVVEEVAAHVDEGVGPALRGGAVLSVGVAGLAEADGGGDDVVGFGVEVGVEPAPTVEAALAGVDAAPSSSAPATPALLEQTLALPRARLVIDGYNVTKQRWPSASLEAQRSRLVAAL